MDVRLCFFALLFAACSQSKSPENVFVSASSCGGKVSSTRFVVEWEGGDVTVEGGLSKEDFKKNFVAPQLESIRKVYPDQRLQFLKKDFSSQVSSMASASGVELIPNWGQAITQAEAVWGENVLGENITVGVVDSFVDVTHNQLKTRIAYNKKEIPDNGIDDDGNGYIDDYAGMSFISSSSPGVRVSEHGSHVSGIIAADSSLGPMKGMAPKALIIPAPFIANDGSGSLADAVLALDYVASQGAHIINASWGGSSEALSALQKVFQKLQAKGVLVVVAAGNDGTEIDQCADFPVSFNLPNQINVAASTAADYMAWWSNSSFNFVHLAAPGDYIYSTTPGNTYQYFQGTSMAAPFVSGASALLMSAFPNATALEIKDALLKSVDIIPAHEFRVSSRGRMNVKKALDRLRSSFQSSP